MADVVVVEDDSAFAEAVADVLASEGHTVRIGQDGEQGLKLLTERLPDLIVLDVEMPVLTGPEMAARALVHDAGQELIPIVLLSGVADLSRVAAVIGTPYVLKKPCDLVALIETTSKALREQVAPQPSAALAGMHV
jgi:CheY-like chemotaxis protein